MIIKKIEITNFRNISKTSFDCCDNINIIFGENAKGKTNTLEAIWLFTGAKSFRGSKDNELTNFNFQKSEIKINFFSEQREQTCEIEIETNRKAILNGVNKGLASNIFGKIPMTVFSPNDISLIKDGPAIRRKFLDISIGQIYPTYIENLKNYTKALNQRNFILKDLKYHPELLSFLEDFEAEIVNYGMVIVEYRKHFINELKPFLDNIYSGLSSQKEKIEIEYISSVGETKQEFFENLKNARKEDFASFTTSIGPHRDDFEIKINNLSARSFGSQGQKRSAALACKLAEAEVVAKITGIKPIALLDDVMSELDKNRQNYILNHIKDRQVFITCCDPTNISDMTNGKVFLIENGEINEIKR